MFRFTLLLLVAATASAQKKELEKKPEAPKILYAAPLVVTPGEKQKLAIRGKFLETTKDVKVTGADGAKVKVLGGKKTPVGNNQPGERLGDTELEIELELPKGTKPGATLIAVGPGGDSAPYTLLIPDGPAAVKEKEPNDGFDAAQLVTFPSAVEATIKAERDVDVFKFEGKKGAKVRIEVQAARFGSPVDAMISLYDPERKLIATVDDTDGSHDPVLNVVFPQDGIYFLSVIDAHDLGGPLFGYRLLVK